MSRHFLLTLVALSGCAALTRKHRNAGDESAIRDQVKALRDHTETAERERSAAEWRDVVERVGKLDTQLAYELDVICAAPTPDRNYSEICEDDHTIATALADSLRRLAAPAAWQSERDRLRVMIEAAVRFQNNARYAATAIGMTELPKLVDALNASLTTGLVADAQGWCALGSAGSPSVQLEPGSAHVRCGLPAAWHGANPWVLVRARRPEAAARADRVTYDEIERGGWRAIDVQDAVVVTPGKRGAELGLDVSPDSIIAALRREDRGVARGDYAIVELRVGLTENTGAKIVTRDTAGVHVDDEHVHETIASGALLLKWR